MAIVAAANPRYAREDNSILDLDVTLDTGEQISFTASPLDLAEHGRLLWEKAQNGEFGPIQPYEAP